MPKQFKHIVQVNNAAEALLEVSNILISLRHYTRTWETTYGAVSKNDKKRWERIADNWLRDNVKSIEG